MAPFKFVYGIWRLKPAIIKFIHNYVAFVTLSSLDWFCRVLMRVFKYVTFLWQRFSCKSALVWWAFPFSPSFSLLCSIQDRLATCQGTRDRHMCPTRANGSYPYMYWTVPRGRWGRSFSATRVIRAFSSRIHRPAEMKHGHILFPRNCSNVRHSIVFQNDVLFPFMSSIKTFTLFKQC